MQIIPNGRFNDDQTEARTLIRIERNESILIADLVATAEALNAYFEKHITYEQYRDEKKYRVQFKHKVYCIEVGKEKKMKGRLFEEGYTLEELWYKLAHWADCTRYS